MLAWFRHNEVGRAGGILAGSAAVAHLVTAISLPVVTRLYTPQEMGVLALFTSLLALTTSWTCLRFDVAVPIPASDEDAINLACLGALAAVFVSLLIGVSIWVGLYDLMGGLDHPAILPFLWLLPIAVLIVGFYNLHVFWFVRTRGFSSVARSRVCQSVCAAAVQIAAGLGGAGPVGLIVGHMFNNGSGSLYMARQFIRRSRRIVAAVNWARMSKLACSYRRFPCVLTFEAIAESAHTHLPIVIIALVAAPAEAGYLLLAIYVLQLPLALMGNAVAQVYISSAAQCFRQGELSTYTLTTARNLCLLGVPLLVGAGALAPLLFPYLFGEPWERAGYIAVMLLPWVSLQLVVSPISSALYVTERQGLALLLQLGGLVIRIGAVLLASHIDPEHMVTAHAASGAIFYAWFLIVVLRAVGIRPSELAREVVAKPRWLLPLIASCAFAAIVCSTIIWA